MRLCADSHHYPHDMVPQAVLTLAEMKNPVGGVPKNTIETARAVFDKGSFGWGLALLLLGQRLASLDERSQ